VIAVTFGFLGDAWRAKFFNEEDAEKFAKDKRKATEGFKS
jgi:hypothetical protein